MTRLLGYVIACGLLLGGCGGSSAGSAPESMDAEESAGGEAPTTSMETTPPAAPSVPVAEWDAMNVELVELDQEFESELSAGNCNDAGDLRDRICELADRICVLADETEDPLTEQRCEDGNTRCSNARERVADSCE